MSELAVALFAASTESHLLDEPRTARFERFRAELDEPAVLADLERRGIRWIPRGSPGYPARLRRIHDPPPGLFGGEGKPSDRPIYRSDIDSDTPYNTYRIAGLPPAPIAIPGRASLEAVANPSQTDDLYFVADGSGGHAFAQTLDEHNRNVARWRQIERERKAQAAAAAPAAAKPAVPPAASAR